MSEAAPIVPRWEWRTFGDSFGSAEAELTRWIATGEGESDERYLLSTDGENVKIRDDLLDIKVLREVDHRGLERWEPTHKASFPLDHSTLAAAFAALRQPPAVLSRPSYSQDQFLGELVEPTDPIRIVNVHKRRVRYTHGDCMGELTDFDVDGARTRTLALESIDPTTLAARVDTLGLGDRINTSVPRALLNL